MQKVVIADDEEKVCQLIEKLINWEELDMQVAAVAHNGLEAYKEITEKRPDVVITDICMPGMDGLKMIREIKKLYPQIKMIIISGYRHFEYAQNALRYGVNDYLLKPIKKADLYNTLQKIHEEYLQRTEQLTFEEKYLLSMKNDVEKIRTGFLSDLLYPKGKKEERILLEKANEDCYFRFCEGVFQIICIKMDGVGIESAGSFPVLADKVRAALSHNLKDICYDMEIYFESSRAYCLLNYSDQKRKSIHKNLKNILNDLLLIGTILQGFHITIGCGSTVACLNQIRISRQNALRAVEQRLLAGTDRVIEEKDIPFTANEAHSRNLADLGLFREFNRNMMNALERLEEGQVAQQIDSLREKLLSVEAITGHEILQMAKEVCNVYLLYMRQQNFIVPDGEFFVENFNVAAEEFYEVDALFAYLKEKILTSFHKAAEEKRMADNRPIRIAKQYIREHYDEPLTLEEISEVVGFNTTYFSSLFKKETGKAYSEYLFEIRMEQAKAMLRGSNENVASICEKVGYSDVKYFTKSFIKYSGLKPKEYRKLYS